MYAPPRSFLALLVAMVGAGAIAVSLVGCQGETGPVTAEKSQFRPADDTESAPATDAAPAGESLTPAEAADPDETMINPPLNAAGDAATGDDAGDDAPAPAAPPAASNPRAGAKGAANPTTSAATLAVPKSENPKALWQFMEELKERAPRGASQQEMLEDFVRIQNARMAAGEKILASDADEQMKLDVLQAMQQIFLVYMDAGIPGASQRLKGFADNMAQRKDPTLSQYGKLLQFQLRLSQMMGQPTTTGEDIEEEVQALLDQYKDAPPTAQQNAMALAASVSDMLEQNDMRDTAVRVQQLIAKEMRNSKDPQIAEQAAMMDARIKITEANLNGLTNDVLTGEEGGAEKLAAAVTKLLEGENPSIVFVSPLQEVGQLMEYSGNVDAARHIYTALAEAYKNHSSERVAGIVEEMTANALARLNLVGKPFDVAGLTRDGEPFDWQSYRGKVVLVDFWATWCGPCLQEIPNIRENLETFKDKGFDVVGVNLNVDVADVDQFNKVQKLPWPSVFSQQQLDGETFESWAEIPMAKKYGVDAIPFIVLVDKEGNVDSLHVRGPKLAARLGELLGGEEGEEKAESGERKTEEEAPAEEKTSAAEPTSSSASSFPRSAWERTPGRSASSALATLLFGALYYEDPAAGDEIADKPAVADKPLVSAEVNPYSAKPGLTAGQLETWLEKMLDKPKTIQARPGFTEAVAEACDRLLKMEPKPGDSALLLAAETKLHILHQAACNGDEKADEQLQATVKQFAGDERPKMVRLIAFYQAERKALDGAEAPLDEVPATLTELQEFFEKENLAAKHLRMASATVALINRIEDGDEREKHFETFGNTFATSSDKELARYGRKLAKKPAVQQSDLVGKELQLEGLTTQGAPLAWNTYRGKVVVVDFWATWCGPCQKELPNVIAAYEKHKDQGFEVLGISLDKDLEALSTFLEQKPLPWPTLAGEETEDIATRYGVRGIPTLLLVDRDGKVAAVAHRIQELQPQIEKLLSGKADKKDQ